MCVRSFATPDLAPGDGADENAENMPRVILDRSSFVQFVGDHASYDVIEFA